MKRFFGAIRRFFFPPADAKTFTRILPLATIAFLMILLFAFTNYAWEESNAPTFCGLTCHTMPPEYSTYKQSPHTNVTCEDCHMGRDRLPILVQRKITYSWQTGSAMLLNTYEFPIYAKNMAPAREACENCHKPEKFSTDTLVENKHYAEDEANSPSSVFLSLKTGGGLRREGLGYGIHWHIENQTWFYATDAQQQNIPYVMVVNADGTQTEYTDIEANIDTASIDKSKLKKMDCITCHNRTAHEVSSPQASMDSLISRSLVSVKIPEIKKKGVEVLSASYPNTQAALDAIAGLSKYYQDNKSDFYAANKELVESAVQAIQEQYQLTNFPAQKVDWSTHANNLEHGDSPGCFRCHDGKHLTKTDAAIRLECNLCHSIPVTTSPNKLTANLELSKGFEPDSHKNSNWINLHRTVFDESCAGCHTVEDPGGVSDTSFCSNSACHGKTWEFAGFDAPNLRAVIAEQARAMITPTPVASPTPEGGAVEPTATPQAGGGAASSDVTFDAVIGPMLTSKCGSCHGAAAMKGLNVTTYAALMKGGDSGPSVVAGDPGNSLIIKVQTGPSPHFGQLAADEIEKLKTWIQQGAKEK